MAKPSALMSEKQHYECLQDKGLEAGWLSWSDDRNTLFYDPKAIEQVGVTLEDLNMIVTYEAYRRAPQTHRFDVFDLQPRGAVFNGYVRSTPVLG